MGDIAWALAYGVLSRMGASSLRQEDPNTSLILMVSHAAFGLTSAWLLRNIANPNLFGKRKSNNLLRSLFDNYF